MNIIGFAVSFLCFVGGIYLFSSAASFPGFESLAFIGGVLIASLGLFIPVHIMKRIDS